MPKSKTGDKHRFDITLEILILKEDDSFVAYSPALNLTTYGNSIEDVKNVFGEVVQLFIEETMRTKTLEQELLKLGWQLKQVPEPLYQPPSISFSILKDLKILSSFNQNVQLSA